jgi:hypothetical protein
MFTDPKTQMLIDGFWRGLVHAWLEPLRIVTDAFTPRTWVVTLFDGHEERFNSQVAVTNYLNSLPAPRKSPYFTVELLKENP